VTLLAHFENSLWHLSKVTKPSQKAPKNCYKNFIKVLNCHKSCYKAFTKFQKVTQIVTKCSQTFKYAKIFTNDIHIASQTIFKPSLKILHRLSNHSCGVCYHPLPSTSKKMYSCTISTDHAYLQSLCIVWKTCHMQSTTKCNMLFTKNWIFQTATICTFKERKSLHLGPIPAQGFKTTNKQAQKHRSSKKITNEMLKIPKVPIKQQDINHQPWKSPTKCFKIQRVR
jgi:hypothetical protein